MNGKCSGTLTRVSVDPKYNRGGVRAQNALQRANGDTVVAAESDGNSPGRSLSAPECELKFISRITLNAAT